MARQLNNKVTHCPRCGILKNKLKPCKKCGYSEVAIIEPKSKKLTYKIADVDISKYDTIIINGVEFHR
jgi:ribosomal protein L37E